MEVDDAHLELDDVVQLPDPGTANPNANPLDDNLSTYSIQLIPISVQPQDVVYSQKMWIKNCMRRCDPAGTCKEESRTELPNGHAVDAVHLLVPSGNCSCIYDIIQSSASSDAKPVFNYAGPPRIILLSSVRSLRSSSKTVIIQVRRNEVMLSSVRSVEHELSPGM